MAGVTDLTNDLRPWQRPLVMHIVDRDLKTMRWSFVLKLFPETAHQTWSSPAPHWTRLRRFGNCRGGIELQLKCTSLLCSLQASPPLCRRLLKRKTPRSAVAQRPPIPLIAAGRWVADMRSFDNLVEPRSFFHLYTLRTPPCFLSHPSYSF